MAIFGSKGGSIRRRVMEVIETRIADGQVEFDREAAVEDTKFAEGVRALQESCSNAKLAAEHRIVNSITN